MVNKKLIPSLCLLLLLWMLALPFLMFCSHTCHTRLRGSFDMHACCNHPSSTPHIRASSGCHCSFQSRALPFKEASFALLSSGGEELKFPAMRTSLSPQTLLTAADCLQDSTRSPFSGENTLLWISSLRI